MKAKSQKETWQGMFSRKDGLQQLIGKMINDQKIRSLLKQSLSDTYNVRKRRVMDALLERLKYKNLLSKSMESSAEAIERN